MTAGILKSKFVLAFSAVLASLILLYTPLITLNYYSSSLTELIHDGGSYRVLYKSLLVQFSSSNETKLVLYVKHNGKPVDFGYTLSGITVDGGRDVARGRGQGRVVVDISGYVDDVIKVLREANANPAFNGLGLLAFIVSKVEENGEEYVVTDVISIPIIPGKARGKQVIVEVEFKPVHKVRVKDVLENLSNIAVNESNNMRKVMQTTPPGAITDYCIFYPTYPKPVIVCYVWEFKTVHYKSSSPEIAPVNIAFIDPIDGNNITRVQHYTRIILSTSTATTLSFDISLVFKKVIEFIVPGPGFTIQLSSGSQILDLFSLDCPIVNLKLVSNKLACSYYGSPIGYYGFYDEAIVATGFTGYMWLVEYEYSVHVNGLKVKVLDQSLAVFLVPYQTSDNKFKPSIEIDDVIWDGVGFENVYLNIVNANTSWIRLPSQYTNYWYVDSYTLLVKTQSTPLFGLAIPVGAIILAKMGVSPTGWAAIVLASLVVGFSVSEGESHFYLGLAKTSFEANTRVTFNPRYLNLTVYLVKEAGNEFYRTPFMLIWPFVE